MRIFLSSIGLVFVVAVGCATGGEKLSGSNQAQQRQSKNGPVIDYPSLIKSLRALGAGATASGDVEQPFFSITGIMIKVHGEDVQVFQYANAAAADAEAAPDFTRRYGGREEENLLGWSTAFFQAGKTSGLVCRQQ